MGAIVALKVCNAMATLIFFNFTWNYRKSLELVNCSQFSTAPLNDKSSMCVHFIVLAPDLHERKEYPIMRVNYFSYILRQTKRLFIRK